MAIGPGTVCPFDGSRAHDHARECVAPDGAERPTSLGREPDPACGRSGSRPRLLAAPVRTTHSRAWSRAPSQMGRYRPGRCGVHRPGDGPLPCPGRAAARVSPGGLARVASRAPGGASARRSADVPQLMQPQSQAGAWSAAGAVC